MKNFGFSCYINSLLQCLFYIQELRNYFISQKDYFNKREQPVCHALSEVMYGLKYEYQDYYEPKNFLKIMGKKNILFCDFRPADTKDLLFNIIDSVLYELLLF